MAKQRLAATLAAIGMSIGAAAVVSPAAGAAELPVLYNGIAGYAHLNPTASPPGANNWSCKPSTAHPRPVVLVHGTFGDMADSWQALSPLLYDNGYCVFALNYGGNDGSEALGVDAIGEIPKSAEQLASFIDRVLSATGASRVDIVGHSQGGMMPRYYMKFLGGASKVHTLIGLAPSNHGTTLNGIFTLAGYFPGASLFLGALCPACSEQASESSFIQKLNAGGETSRGVDYTVIESKYDEVVTPYTSAFLSGPNVTNILLQEQCSLDDGEHLSMPYDHIADADVLTALDPKHPQKPACTYIAPVAGG
ncbi:MAG TPA: alpha/beta fold hydrolase [Solirubrobacteraceae bacterium]|jgi:triacylglycerol esterase/lipase EstA (alpha/beta hydrolase family)